MDEVASSSNFLDIQLFSLQDDLVLVSVTAHDLNQSEAKWQAGDVSLKTEAASSANPVATDQ